MVTSGAVAEDALQLLCVQISSSYIAIATVIYYVATLYSMPSTIP